MAAPNITGNLNTHDEATLSDAITVGGTSVVIAEANPNRLFFHVHNFDGNEAIWIKLQAASVDNDKKGIFIEKNGAEEESAAARSFWEMATDNVYTGEISAIAVSGTPTVYITEY